MPPYFLSFRTALAVRACPAFAEALSRAKGKSKGICFPEFSAAYSSRAAKVLFVYSRASASLARNFRPTRPVPLDKSEGVVKTEISWAVREHRLLCQRRLRTKTLEISPESLCGGIVPPTIDST